MRLLSTEIEDRADNTTRFLVVGRKILAPSGADKTTLLVSTSSTAAPARIEPAPERGRRTPWSTFLKAHWKVLAASDFLTVEVWTGRGLITYYLLFVISLADRVVTIAGITTRPDEAWMLQVARNVTDSPAGALHSKRYLIIDRDARRSRMSSASISSRSHTEATASSIASSM